MHYNTYISSSVACYTIAVINLSERVRDGSVREVSAPCQAIARGADGGATVRVVV